MKRNNRDFNYMERKRQQEQEVAYNVRFEQEQALRRRAGRVLCSMLPDKGFEELRILTAMGII